jgi:hypothetical protein
MLARAQAQRGNVRCAWRSSVDRHFQRRIQPAEESGLRAHLGHCPLCRRRYDRHLLLGQLLPRRREDAADRLATGLGLAAARAPAMGMRWPLGDWRWVMAGMAVGLGAVGLALWTGDPARGRGPATTVAAGPRPDPERLLEIFRQGRDGLAPVTGGTVAVDDRLVFAVRNQHWRYLTVAALEEAGALHVLSPTRAIARAPGLQRLPELSLAGVRSARLRVVALLTDRAPTADALAHAVRDRRFPAIGVRIETTLVVRPRGEAP